MSLDKPFFVLATQNPIEQEGTYPLPEAQLDRFMFNVWLDYPSFQEELSVVKNTTSDIKIELKKIISAEEILYFQNLIRKIPVADNVIEYADEIHCIDSSLSNFIEVCPEFESKKKYLYDVRESYHWLKSIYKNNWIIKK